MKSGHRWLICLVAALTLTCSGCASLRQLILPDPPKCKIGSSCVVPIGLKAFDIAHPDLCVLLVDSGRVRTDGGVVVEWQLDTKGFPIEFIPVKPDGSASGSGIDIDFGKSPPDFLKPTWISANRFSWTAADHGSGLERNYTINIRIEGVATPVPCKLDPIIINEG